MFVNSLWWNLGPSARATTAGISQVNGHETRTSPFDCWHITAERLELQRILFFVLGLSKICTRMGFFAMSHLLHNCFQADPAHPFSYRRQFFDNSTHQPGRIRPLKPIPIETGRCAELLEDYGSWRGRRSGAVQKPVLQGRRGIQLLSKFSHQLPGQ